MSEFSLRGRRKEGKVGRGGEKSAKEGKREGRLLFPLSSIPLPFSLSPYPLSPFYACYAG